MLYMPKLSFKKEGKNNFPRKAKAEGVITTKYEQIVICTVESLVHKFNFYRLEITKTFYTPETNRK